MKKLLFLILISVLLYSCVTNSFTDGDVFITEYNEITGTTKTIHKYLIPGITYNVRDSLTGEREHLSFEIFKNELLMRVRYQNSFWSFFNSIVFLADGERLEISLTSRNSEVVSGSIVREQFTTFIGADKLEPLRTMLASDSCSVAFIGKKYTTNKIKLKPKTRTALLSTVERVISYN